MQTIGIRIKIIRSSFKLNQNDFALKIGVPRRQTISRWENDTQEIPSSKIQLICKHFNISEPWLLNDIGAMKKN